MPKPPAWRPTPKQELLLKAALLKGSKALDAWEQWRNGIDLGSLDQGSARLLQLLYANLRAHGVQDPLLDPLKLSYSQAWMKNQYGIYKLAALLKSFHEAGIETLVLKGTALTIKYYQDFGVRPMNDYDIAVSSEQVFLAMDLLVKLEWKSQEPVPKRLTGIIHATSFSHAATGQQLDLHWHVMHECCSAAADADFWESAIDLQVRNNSTKALNPTDQLLHVCVHGAKWDSIPPIRWAADAMTILNADKSEFDWPRLIRIARIYRLVLPLQDTLNYLRQAFCAPVPDGVLRQLNALSTSKIERFEYRYRNRNYHGLALGYLPIMWFDYLRRHNDRNFSAKWIGFAKYVQRFWGAESFWQLPVYGAHMLKRRIKEILSSRSR